jgi:hypothetical protein
MLSLRLCRFAFELKFTLTSTRKLKSPMCAACHCCGPHVPWWNIKGRFGHECAHVTLKRQFIINSSLMLWGVCRENFEISVASKLILSFCYLQRNALTKCYIRALMASAAGERPGEHSADSRRSPSSAVNLSPRSDLFVLRWNF